MSTKKIRAGSVTIVKRVVKHEEDMEPSTKDHTESRTKENASLPRTSIATHKEVRQGGTESGTREDVFLLKTSIATHKEVRQWRQ